jgi:hypothetical protein
MVQTLKANLDHGWPNQLNGQLKDAANMESDMLKYIFSNAVMFLSKVITIFIDESSGRENLMQYFKLLNTASPFLIMNDYRIAKQ